MSNVIPTALSLIKTPTKIVDGINIYESRNYNAWFESTYSQTAEPWKYSNRAAELNRYKYVVEQIQRYHAASKIILELGCSKGLMTELLIPFSRLICAADISNTALKACKQRCDPEAKKYDCSMEYYLTTTPGLPFTAESFDTVTICDGLTGWWLSGEQKRIALQDTFRVLKRGGIAVLTDHSINAGTYRNEFREFETLIRNSPFSIVEMGFLYDKLWYKMESLLKKARLERLLSSVLASIPIARTLNSLGRFAGRRAACHIVAVLRKD